MAGSGTGVEIQNAKIATGVKDREAEGEGTTFKADVGRLYCWMKVKGAEGRRSARLYRATRRWARWSWRSSTPPCAPGARRPSPGHEGRLAGGHPRPDGAVLQSLKFTVEG